MKKHPSLFVAKGLFVAGVALWLTLIVFNNLTDPGTNRYLLGQMFTMEGLKADPHLGQGLTWRALDWDGLPTAMLYLVATIQLVTASALWRSAGLFARHVLGKGAPLDPVRVVGSANLAFSCLLGLFLFFLCGGMWFGYWIKLGAVQGVHMQFLVVSLIGLVLVNTREYAAP